MDQLHAMRLFVRVTEAGNFAAVAQQMDVARSVVTRQIAALEQHLGVKLLARSTRRLSLTSAGAEYLEKVRDILALVDEAETGLAAERSAPKGLIRMTLPLSLGLNQLTPLIGDFIAANPEVSVELDFSDRRTHLVEEGFDLALRITREPDPTEVVRRLSSCQMKVVASPAYLARHGTPQHPRELVDHECFGYVPAQRSTWPFLVDEQIEWFPVKSRVRANNGDALLDLARQGLGITNPPSFIANPALAAGEVVSILREFPSPTLGIFAVFPGNRFVPHRVRVLVDYLAERIGPQPFWETPPRKEF